MKLLHVHDREQLTGGAEMALSEAALGLAARGHQNLLAVPTAAPICDPRQDGLPEERRQQSLLRRGGFVACRRLAGGSSLDVRQDLLGLVAAWQPDLVIVHNFAHARQEVEEQGIPMVRMLHDYAPICPRTTRTTFWRRKTCAQPSGMRCLACLGFLRRDPSARAGFRLKNLISFQRQAEELRRLRLLIVPSGEARRQLILSGYPPERIAKVPLGRDFAIQPGPPQGRLLFVGNLVRGKGADLLIDAVAQTETFLAKCLGQGFKLDIVGQGPERSRLVQRVARLGLRPRIVFHGRIDGTALATRYRLAAAVICPSRTPETFGLVGLEAMASARPVVATPAGGFDEWLQPGYTGVRAAAGDARAIAAALEDLFAPRNDPETMGQNARRVYLSRFTRAAFARRLEVVFKRACGIAREVLPLSI